MNEHLENAKRIVEEHPDEVLGEYIISACFLFFKAWVMMLKDFSEGFFEHALKLRDEEGPDAIEQVLASVGIGMYQATMPTRVGVGMYVAERGLQRLLETLYLEEDGKKEFVIDQLGSDTKLRAILDELHKLREKDPEHFEELREPLLKKFNYLCSLREYGLIDFPEQLLDIVPDYKTCEGQQIVLFTKFTKERDGGMRFHKNGGYLGTQQCHGYEYWKDEPGLDELYMFHVLTVADWVPMVNLDDDEEEDNDSS